MSKRRSDHLSEEQLAQFQDGHLPEREVNHLEVCSECSARLSDLEAAGVAYREYLASGSALPSPPQLWRSLDGLVAEYEMRRSRRAWRSWMVPALGTAICLGIVIGLVRRTGPAPSIPANELLVRSAIVELPRDRMISLHLRGRSLVRPAVLLSSPAEQDSDLAHLEMLFDKARYSWREPLSARSFQSWRSGLRDKRDSVTVIHGGGPEPAYRVRTDTATGVLRSAALTLRGKDLRPTEGAFQFEGEQALEMEETATPVPPHEVQRALSERRYEPAPIPVESLASPADTLHVLAALNAIGADVGDPIEVAEDPQRQVLVSAAGLNPERARQVASVLESLPHVRVVLGAADGHPSPAQTTVTERSSAGMPGTLRQRFEDRLGGAVALQEITDRVLEASGLAVARAHALDFLATKFPDETEAGLAKADRALLGRLRQVHITALDELTMRIAADLEPILPASSLAGAHLPPELMAVVQQLDDSLNRLLAGSYSEPSGQALLSGLAGQLANLRRIITLRKESGK